MSMSINQRFSHFLKTHPKTRHWMWFVVLWCAGLASVFTIARLIKALMTMAS